MELEFVLRPTVSRPRLGIGLAFGAHDQILSFLFDSSLVVIPRAPSLTRGRVCNLQCNRCLVRSLWTNNHILPSHLRLCSLFVAPYDSQGLQCSYSNPSARGTVRRMSVILLYIQAVTGVTGSELCPEAGYSVRIFRCPQCLN
jgi:hypothetical protein